MKIDNHCKDCCCAQSWKALGVSEYTGKSIPEHIKQLRAKVEELERDKARLNWLESQRAALGCTMGALGVYHYQVGTWPSEHSYRAAIDAQMARTALQSERKGKG